MTDWYRETDSEVGEMPLKDSSTKRFGLEPSTPGTVSGSYNIRYTAETDVNNIFAQAFKTLDETEDTRVKENAMRILRKIYDILVRYKSEDLPQLYAVNSKDGSVQIEWPFDDFRVGFTIEKAPEETGWYMVSKENLDRRMAAGNLSDTNEKSTLDSLLNFIMQNG